MGSQAKPLRRRTFSTAELYRVHLVFVPDAGTQESFSPGEVPSPHTIVLLETEGGDSRRPTTGRGRRR